MNKVSGRILLGETGTGIRDLLVTVYDVDVNAVPGGNTHANWITDIGTLWNQLKGDRLGSVITDANGTFTLEYDGDAGRSNNDRKGPDLLLFVTGPENSGSHSCAPMLHVSCGIREGAAPSEQYLIKLTDEQLQKAGISLPRTIAARILTSTVPIKSVFENNVRVVTARKELFRKKIRQRIRRELSQVSEEERTNDRFVPADSEIQEKYIKSLRQDLAALSNEAPTEGSNTKSRVFMRSRLLLTNDQKGILTGYSTKPVTITEAEAERRLGVLLDKPPEVFRLHLEPDPCRPKTNAERCVDGTDDINGSDAQADGSQHNANSGGNDGSGNVNFDKDRAIAKIMARQDAPERPVDFGTEAKNGDGVSLESPLTAGGVSDVISKVLFAPGPADIPAFYDFHDLQIAFQPVWQEALDDKFLEDVEAAYDQFVERGGATAVDNIAKMVDVQSIDVTDALLDGLLDIGEAARSHVPTEVASAVSISLEEWRILPDDSKSYLRKVATDIKDLRKDLLAAMDPENLQFDLDKLPESWGDTVRDLIRSLQTSDAIAYRAKIMMLTEEAERLVAHGRRLLLEREASEPFRPSHEIIEQLRHRGRQSYPFRYFAASAKHRSVNFGILVTYRQKWTPISYQVGELVKTIPLAPKEVRKFTKKTVIKKKRAQKEIESNLIARKGESETKTRAESEIVARANARTNFALTNQETINIGGKEGPVGGSGTMTTTFARDAEKHSQSIKKGFREAVVKCAEEYKNERKTEVNTEEIFEEEITESGEIQNPNDEIVVTFLFYELQRRFSLSEKIHRLQSVVLVAQEVPPPSAIDKAWIIRNDWILNRGLLDDSFKPALSYMSTTLISDEITLREMRLALLRQRKLVEELKEDLADRRVQMGLRYAALQRQIERTAKSAGSGGGGLFGSLGDLVGSVPIVGDVVQGGLDVLTGSGEGSSEAAQIREGAARDAYEREQRESQELSSRLENALSTLDAMQRAYTERLAEYMTQLAQCERLLNHVRDHILVYMQLIWAHEPDDQRFLRLRNVPVPVFEKNKDLRTYEVHPGGMKGFVDFRTPDARPYEVITDFQVIRPPLNADKIETKPLSEVADLNRPLGFKGNYIIFPMLAPNPITEFMMDPYATLAEGEYGLSDPDPLGNMTLDEFSQYVCCLKKYFDKQRQQNPPQDDVGASSDPFEEMKPFLRGTLKRLLQLSLRNDEEIVIPSESLYIEALPGAHSVIEKFKHLHRQVDVKKAQEEVRAAQLHNIRMAARVLADDYEDPDIEKKIMVEGNVQGVSVGDSNGA